MIRARFLRFALALRLLVGSPLLLLSVNARLAENFVRFGLTGGTRHAEIRVPPADEFLTVHYT